MISLLFGSARFYHPTIKPGELSSGSSGRVRGGGKETWNLCGRLRWPSFLWLIFTGPGGMPHSAPPGSATGTLFYQPKYIYSYFLVGCLFVDLVALFICWFRTLLVNSMTLRGLSAGYFCALRRFPASRMQDLNVRSDHYLFEDSSGRSKEGVEMHPSIQYISFSCSLRDKFSQIMGWQSPGVGAPSKKSWKRHWVVCIITVRNVVAAR